MIKLKYEGDFNMDPNERKIIRFIDRLYMDLYKSEEVLHYSSGTETEKFRNLSEYFNIMGKLHNWASLTQKRREMIKHLYHQKYVIKASDIPDSYYGMRERIALEKGLGHRKFDHEERLRIQREVITNQTKSLDDWLDYFLSEASSTYPFWVKYWAFQGMLTMGSFNKKEGVFNERSKQTVAKFVDLNLEALSLSMDIVIKFLNKEEITDQELEQLVKNGSFSRIYTYMLNVLSKNKGTHVKNNEGIWVKYNQGSDHIPLVRSLAGYNTGWCIDGEETARVYLANSDIYVYYTLDETGEYKVPRIVIRTENTEVVEVSGLEQGQELEPKMKPIANAKLEEFPNKEKYLKKLNDMRTLTKIYDKQNSGVELSTEELRFLYEVDAKITLVEYDFDPRINEIKSKRNIVEDYRKIFQGLESFTGNLTFPCVNEVSDLVFPKIFTGSLYLGELSRAKNLVLPEKFMGTLYLDVLESAEGIVFPKTFIGNLNLNVLESVQGLVLPKIFNGGLLNLSKLKSAENLVLPQAFTGNLILDGLESVRGLVLPKYFKGILSLRGLSSEDLYNTEGFTCPKDIYIITSDGEFTYETFNKRRGSI